MHNYIVFKPILIEALFSIEIKHALECFISLPENKSEECKPNHAWTEVPIMTVLTNSKEAGCPIAMTEPHLIAAVIDVKQRKMSRCFH